MSVARRLEHLRRRNWFRALAQAPLLGFRLGLGPVIGRAFLVLTTRCRATGLSRHTVLLFCQLEGVRYVAAAYGRRSDWYRNVQADRLVTVVGASGAESCIARPVTEAAEVAHAVRALRGCAPMRAYLASLGIATNEPSAEEISGRVLLVALEPTAQRSPPSVRADLGRLWLWLLPLAALAFAGLRRARATASGGP